MKRTRLALSQRAWRATVVFLLTIGTCTTGLFAQKPVKGVVKDAANNEPVGG